MEKEYNVIKSKEQEQQVELRVKYEQHICRLFSSFVLKMKNEPGISILHNNLF